MMESQEHQVNILDLEYLSKKLVLVLMVKDMLCLYQILDKRNEFARINTTVSPLKNLWKNLLR